MSRFSLRGLTPQLFVIVILPLTVLVLAITFGGLQLHRQAMRNLVGERDERAARAAANTLREQLKSYSAAVHGLALRAELAGSPENLSETLRDSDFLLTDFDGGLAFISSDGKVVTSIGGAGLWGNLDAETRAELQALLRNQAASTFIGFANPQTGEPMMLAVSPVPQTELIVVGAFSPATPARNALADLFSPGAGAAAFVVDENMHVLFHMGTLPQEIEISKHPGVREALEGESGATYLQMQGSEHVIAFSPVSPVGWALVIEEPWEAVASPLLRATEYAPLVLIPVLILALVALWFGTRRIVQPLQQLESKAAELGWGNYEAIEEPVRGVTEIRRLQSELIHLAHKVRSAHQALRGYIGAITMGQEDERRRLARELHDDTLQSLIALNQRVQLTMMSLNGDREVEALAEIQNLTEETIQNLRRVTRALRPIYLEDLGLVAALEMLTRELEQSSSLSVDFEKSGPQRRLQPTEELALYRIIQEALSNVIRHGQATKARLIIHFTDQAVILQVADNGKGFEVPESPAEFAPSGHFGLLGMHERADLIGARLEINSTPSEGTRVELELPLKVNQKG